MRTHPSVCPVGVPTARVSNHREPLTIRNLLGQRLVMADSPNVSGHGTIQESAKGLGL